MSRSTAAGTGLRVPGGWRKIEEIAVGDCVLSRDEHDVSGEVESKRVEAVFVREGLLTRLRLGGREILSTNEHPFYVWGRGWLPLHSVAATSGRRGRRAS